jgi:hypothetical protein
MVRRRCHRSEAGGLATWAYVTCRMVMASITGPGRSFKPNAFGVYDTAKPLGMWVRTASNDSPERSS